MADPGDHCRLMRPERSIVLPSAAVGVHYRVDTTKLFTAAEVDGFLALYQDPAVSEQQLHAFFASHPQFLFLLGAYEEALSEVSFTSTRRRSDGRSLRLRLDFALKDGDGLWDIVELKKPRLDGPLVVGSVQRRHFSASVQQSIAQVRTYLDELQTPSVREQLAASSVFVSSPQAWLVIGRDDELPAEERRFLERSLERSVRLVTYDSIARLAKDRVLIVTTSVLLPGLKPPTSPPARERWTVERSRLAAEEKRLIAEYVVQHNFLTTGSSVVLDAGTTSVRMFQELLADMNRDARRE